jgi:RNA polymerase sigma-70 factor (ECF subfamily)
LDGERSEITALLQAAAKGDGPAKSRLMELVYSDLLRLARYYMARERRDHTLQPSALVNEAYMRLTGGAAVDWRNRAHFFAMAAKSMRRILVDYARERKASKRGGDQQKVDLQTLPMLNEVRLEEVVDVDEALTRLAGWDERQSRIVEMRFFGGLTEEEIADLLDVSVRTVKREWSLARAWLFKELRGPAQGPEAE